MARWVGAIAHSRGLIADRAGATVELYPVVAGAVVDEGMVSTTMEDLAAGVASLCWDPPADPRDDTPWLLPWLHGKRTGSYVELAPGETAAAIAARLFA
jgi:hypothetical protein